MYLVVYCLLCKKMVFWKVCLLMIDDLGNLIKSVRRTIYVFIGTVVGKTTVITVMLRWLRFPVVFTSHERNLSISPEVKIIGQLGICASLQKVISMRVPITMVSLFCNGFEVTWRH